MVIPTIGFSALYRFSELLIIGGRVLQELSVLAKARPVAGTVPRTLGFVVFKSTTQMRATGYGGGQKIHKSFHTVYH